MAGIEVATGELMRTKKQSFIKKYGLEGKGQPVRVSKETKEVIKAMLQQSEASLAASEHRPKTTSATYG
jgi:hypothetical protein